MKAVIVNDSPPASVCTIEKPEHVMMLVVLPEGGVMCYADGSSSLGSGCEPLNRIAKVTKKRVDVARGEVRLWVENFDEYGSQP